MRVVLRGKWLFSHLSDSDENCCLNAWLRSKRLHSVLFDFIGWLLAINTIVLVSLDCVHAAVDRQANSRRKCMSSLVATNESLSNRRHCYWGWLDALTVGVVWLLDAATGPLPLSLEASPGYKGESKVM